MDGSFGRALADAIMDLIVAGILGSLIVGIILPFAVPWLWHFIAAHVTIS